jgi:hypothetical protein
MAVVLYRTRPPSFPAMLRCGKPTGRREGGQRIGRVKGKVLERPPSTAKAWPLT